MQSTSTPIPPPIQSQSLTTQPSSTIPSQAIQKLQIINYQTTNQHFYFTQCQKQGQKISIISHTRLLVYNQNNSTIYYVNQLPKTNLQYKIQEFLNKPKKESVVINSVEVKSQNKSKILSVIFNKNGQKGNKVIIQWKFAMESQAVAVNWVNFVKSKKQEKTVRALQQYKRSQSASKNSPRNLQQPTEAYNNNNNYNLNNQNNTNNTNNNYLNPQTNYQQPKNNSVIESQKQPPKTNSNLNQSTINPTSNTNQNNQNPSPNMISSITNRSPLLNSTTNNNTSSKLIQKQKQPQINRNTTPNKSSLTTNPNNKNTQQINNYNKQSRTYNQPSKIQQSGIKKPVQKQKDNLNLSRQSEQQPSRISYENPNTNSRVNQSKINPTYTNNSRINQTTQPRNQPPKYTEQPRNSTINNPNSNININNKSKTQQPRINQTKNYPKNTSNINNSTYNKQKDNKQQTNQNPRYFPKQNQNKKIQSQRNQRNKQPKNQSFQPQKIEDWNLYFLNKHNEVTLKQFSSYCLQIFQSLNPESIILNSYPQSRQSTLSNKPHQPLTIIKNNIVFQMAAQRTKLSQKLKKQYNNYHYIVQCCKNSKIVNVPLCCIIQYLGIVCLAKVQIKYGGDGDKDGEIVSFGDARSGRLTEKQRDISQQLKMLQMFTKISSQIIKKQAIIVNMSKVYNKQGNNYCIYIDNLINYLPYHPQQPQLQIRPQLIIDNISATLAMQEHSRNQIQVVLNQSFNQLCQQFTQNRLLPISYVDLKNIIHSYGLTLSILPVLYPKLTNRLIKKYVYSTLLCTVLRDQIMTSVMDFRQNSQSSDIIQSVQQAFRIYCQIGINKDYEQIWKNLQKQFKKKYKLNFNINEIQSGYFLSTLMWMMVGEYDINKIDKNKRLFQDKEIILQRFLIKLKSKIKCYNRFMSEMTQRLLSQINNQYSTLNEIFSILPKNQQQKQLPLQLTSLTSPVSQKLVLHISKLFPPSTSSHSSNHPSLQPYIYSKKILNKQPPIQFTHELTLNYANHCRKLGNFEQYKNIIQKSVDVLSYWLGEDCILLCDVYQSLGEYYGNKGNRDDCINFMKQALTTCIRNMGTHSAKVGEQYYKLAQKQLKYGDTAQAFQTYLKSKQNLQSQITPSPVYPLVLHKMGALSLQFSNPQKCIMFSIQALKSCQDTPISQHTQIKIYEVLSRAYQLTQSKQQLKNLAKLSAKIFNNTTDIAILSQMIRICLVGFILTSQPIKQQKIQQYLQISGIINDNYQNNKKNVNQIDKRFTIQGQINKIMNIAERVVVMEKWNKDLQNIQRYINEIKSKRVMTNQGKQFMEIFAAIVRIVGVEFVQGVLNQAKYY